MFIRTDIAIRSKCCERQEILVKTGASEALTYEAPLRRFRVP